jgi:hypothetical protein
MTTKFSAPYNAPTLMCVLRSPNEEDNDGVEAAIKAHMSIEGTERIYRRAGAGFRRFVQTYIMNHAKAAEFQYFIKNFIGEWWLMEDYLGKKWKVMVTTNPIEFTEYERGKPCGRTSVTLDLLAREVV